MTRSAPNKKPISLREEMEHLMVMAKENLVSDGLLIQVVSIVSEKGIVLMHVDSLPPPLLPILIASEVAKRQATRVIRIAEAWVAADPPGTMDPTPAGDRPDRKEAILIEGRDRGGKVEVLEQMFERDEQNNPVFKQEASWFEVCGQSRMLDHVYDLGN